MPSERGATRHPGTPTGGPLTVRRVRFDYPDDLEPGWNHRFPEFAYAANGISLLMPYAEPYFVASIRKALPRLDGPLRARTEDYLRQELQHHRQHRRFNDLLVADSPNLAPLERRIGQAYGWLGRTRSVEFNVAFAAGSECIAYSLARWTERHLDDLFTDADPVPATLFCWHLAEEVEHKTAAFDVFEAVDGSRLRYTWATFVSLVLLNWFVWIAALKQLKTAGRLLSPVAHFRLLRWALSLSFEILPTLAASALPGHHPSSFADPVFLPVWLRQYDPESRTVPLIEPGARAG